MGEQKKRAYISGGSFLLARKILFSEIGCDAYTLQILVHLIGCANFKDNDRFKRGQVPIGERDFAARLGIAHLTLRKRLHWLEERGVIKLDAVRRGRKRGTVVTLLNYEAYQDFATYKKAPVYGSPDNPQNNCGSPDDAQNNHSGSLKDPDQSDCGSSDDPSELLNSDLQLLLASEPFSIYFAQCPPRKREKEKESFGQLIKNFSPDSIARALEYVRAHKVQGRSGNLECCHYPMAYLLHKMDWALGMVSNLPNAKVVLSPAADENLSIEEIERQLKTAKPEHANVLAKLLEKKKGTVGKGEKSKFHAHA